MNNFIKYVFKLFLVLFLVLVFQTYFFTLGKVSGESMTPNLNDGDIVIIDKISPKILTIKRFDIVAVKFPSQKNTFVKRIIGLPKERLEIKNNKLYINNNLVQQNFLSNYSFTGDFSTMDIVNNDQGYIPDNFYLVMGDNRENSLDSRKLGFIDKKNIEIVHKINFFNFLVNRHIY